VVKPDYVGLQRDYGYSLDLVILIEQFWKQNFNFITTRGLQKHVKQELALQILTDDSTKELGYGGAANGAKTWTGCAWEAFMCLTYPGVKFFAAREELKALRGSVLKSMHKVAKEYNFPFEKYWRVNNQDNVITFTNGSTIDLLAIAPVPSDEDYNWLGSLEYTCGWCEELGQAQKNTAYEILKTRIGRHLNDKYEILATMYSTFNPQKTFIYEYFYQRDKKGTLPAHIKFIKALVYDNVFRETGSLAQLEGITIPAQRERLLNGNFDYDDDPRALCDYDAICDLFVNEHVQPGDAYGSADIATRGRDKFVAGNWQGLIGYPRIVKAISTGKSNEQDIRQLMVTYQISHSRFVVDSTGQGDYLESYINGIKEFNFASSAIDKTYFKLKDECGYKLAELINKRQMWIVCDDATKEHIKQEIAVLKADDVDADTKKMKLISKDEMKGYLGRSPDFLDWLILRCWFEVQEFSTGFIGR
jgi:hypothetical protein